MSCKLSSFTHDNRPRRGLRPRRCTGPNLNHAFRPEALSFAPSVVSKGAVDGLPAGFASSNDGLIGAAGRQG